MIVAEPPPLLDELAEPLEGFAPPELELLLLLEPQAATTSAAASAKPTALMRLFLTVISLISYAWSL
ncbi:MAG: hypothetical protein JO169_06190 [Solirubrobacterales bacterium]|nr:hypothetical protein [Solirubrobacterales bacterium]